MFLWLSLMEPYRRPTLSQLWQADHREGVFVQLWPQVLKGQAGAVAAETSKAGTPKGRASAGPGSGLQILFSMELGGGIPDSPPFKSMPDTATQPLLPPRSALTIEVHVFILRVCLSSPRPFLCIQLCDDGIKKSYGLFHICAEL